MSNSTDKTAQALAQIEARRGRPAGFLVDQVQPNAMFYVRDGERLTYYVNNTVSCTIVFSWRQLMMDGTVLDNQQTVVFPASVSGAGGSIQLGEGFLLSLTAHATGVFAYTTGCAFVGVGLTRDPTSAALRTATFIQDYLPPGLGLCWPGGKLVRGAEGLGNIRSIAIAQPAAGAEFTLTVPANISYEILAGRFTFTTSGTVATRAPRLSITDGTNVQFRSLTGNGVAASNIGTYSVFPGQNAITNDAGATAAVNIPAGLIIPGLWVITSDTLSIQVGDQYSAIRLMVRERIDV